MTDTTKKAMTLQKAHVAALRIIVTQLVAGNVYNVKLATGALVDIADAIDAHLSSQREGEAVGCLVITSDSTNQYGKNARFSYSEACMDIPVGEHLVYTAPPHPRVEVTDEMAERAMNAIYNHSGFSIGIDGFLMHDAMRAALDAALSEKGHG